jgi:hypothetical protein
VVVPTCFEYVDTETEVGFRSIVDYPRDTVFPGRGTGAACLVIHRSPLERSARRLATTGSTTSPTRAARCSPRICRSASVSPPPIIPVHVDTGVRTTHDKGGVFLDEDEYDRCRALHASPHEEEVA